MLLPIEVFRDEKQIARLFQGDKVAKKFLSSGTSQQIRAKSLFSEHGLDLYRLESVVSFSVALKNVFANHDPTQVQGYSWVPTTQKWPDSSLAQMLAWIKEFFPLEYVEPEEFFRRRNTGKDPVWIFATASQLVHCFERGRRVKLPKGSVVFETGGTKSFSRKIERPELQSMIAKMFSISERQIVSEYGMSEMSAQAYDIGGLYRFPPWVKTAVSQGFGKMQKVGKGSLCVGDPFRVDFPDFIRTQDLVELRKDGSFSYLGRVPTAPLKGCSMNSELAELGTDTCVPMSYNKEERFVFRDTGVRPQFRSMPLQKFLTSKATLRALTSELGSASAAAHVLRRCHAMLPQDQAAWDEAVRNSQATTFKKWLFILPSNHSVASFYPLALACAAGREVWVRIPEEFEQSNATVLKILLPILKKENPKLHFLPSTYRLRPQMKLPFQAVLAYGASETLKLLKQYSHLPFAGFGSAIAISILDDKDLFSQIKRILKDAFSLSQRGCLSPKVIFYIGAKSNTALNNLLSQAFKNFWRVPLSIERCCALDTLKYELSFQKNKPDFLKQKNKDQPLFPIFNDLAGVEQFLVSPREFVLPVFRLSSAQLQKNMLRLVKKHDAYFYFYLPKHLLMPISLSNCEIRVHGSSEDVEWSGFFQKRPLFSVRQ